jgi:hypothetical protein
MKRRNKHKKLVGNESTELKQVNGLENENCASNCDWQIKQKNIHRHKNFKAGGK